MTTSTLVRGGILFVCTVAVPSVTAAQYGVPAGNPAVGETYHVEIGGAYWSPTPEMIISSESDGIAGSDIDLVADLGIVKKRFTELRVALRPGRKHRFRVHYMPIKYEAETVVQRNLIFNGQIYPVNLRVTSEMEWTTWRLGYEYDALYTDRGFLGVIVEAKYTDVSLSLDSPIAAEFARARAPVPAIGGIGRFYFIPNASFTLEITGLKLPDFDDDYDARYLDIDAYGTVNFSDYVGVQVGYRALDVDYDFDLDAGDFQVGGWYFGGVARF
jgi:hypothetical protein